MAGIPPIRVKVEFESVDNVDIKLKNLLKKLEGKNKLNIEVDRKTLDNVQKQLDELQKKISKTTEVKVDTKNAKNQITNLNDELIKQLNRIQSGLKGAGSTGINFATTKNQYDQIIKATMQYVDKTGEAISKNYELGQSFKKLDSNGNYVTKFKEVIERNDTSAKNKSILADLEKEREAIEKVAKAKAKVEINTNAKGNITSANISYIDQTLGKTITQTYRLTNALKETESQITRTFKWENTNSKFVNNIQQTTKTIEANKNQLQSFEQKATSLLNTFTSPKGGVKTDSYVSDLNSKYEKLSQAINQVKNSGKIMTDEQEREIKQLSFELDQTTKKYKALESIQRQSSGSRSTTKTYSADDISSYVAKWENAIARLKVGKESVFASTNNKFGTTVSQELNNLQNAMSRFKSGNATIKEVNGHMDTLRTRVSQVSNEYKNVNKDGYGFIQMIELGAKKIAVWGVATTLVYGSLRQLKEGMGFLVDQTKVFTNLQMEMTNTNLVFKDIIGTANDYARAMGTTTDSVMRAISVFSTYTSTLDEVLEKSKSAVILSNITGQNIESQADNLMGVMAQFNLDSSKSMYVTDVITGTARMLQIDYPKAVSEVSEGLRTVGSVAKESKVSIEELSAMVGVLSEKNRRSASENANALRTIFGRTLNVGEEADVESMKKVEKQLHNLGISIREIGGNGQTLRSATSVLGDLAKKWNELSDAQKQSLSFNMAGMYRKNTFLTLMSSWKDVEKVTESANNSQGVALEKQAIYAKSLTASIQKLKAEWEKFWTDSASIGMMKGVIGSISSLVSVFGNLPTVMSLVVTGLALWKGAILTTAIANSKFTLSLSGVVAGVRVYLVQMAMAKGITEETATSMGTLSLAMKVNPFGLILTALTTVIIAFDIFKNKIDEAKQKAQEHSQKIQEEKEQLIELTSQYYEITKSGKSLYESKDKLKSIQDQLAKSYGVEAEGIDLVNGKYSEQIKKLDELQYKKYQDVKNSMGATGLEAQRELFEANSSNVKVDSFSIFNPKAFKKGFLDDTTDLDKILSDFKRKYKNAFSLDDENALTGNSTYQINGTLEERVKILGELSTKIQDLSKKDKDYEGIANDVANAYSKLNEKLKVSTDIWQKYAEADFYTSFKSQISQVHILQSQLNNEKDDKKKSVIQVKIDKIKESIEKSKPYLTDYKTFLDELFGVESESKNNSEIELITSNYDELASKIKEVIDPIKELNEVLNKVRNGQKLTADEMLDLITKYPQLTNAVKKSADGYKIEKSALDTLKTSKLDIAITTAKTELGITDAVKKGLEARLLLYGVELKGIQSVIEARKLASGDVLTKRAKDVLMTSLHDPDATQADKAKAKEILSNAKLVSDETIKYAEALEKLKVLEEGLRNPKLGVSDSKSSSSSKADTKANEAVIIKDRYVQLNSELARTNALIKANESKQENATIKEKISLLTTEQSLLKQKQTTLKALQTEERKERDELLKSLDKSGLNFTGKGDLAFISNAKSMLDKQTNVVNSHKNDKNKTEYNKQKAILDKMTDDIKRFNELQSNLIPDLGNDWNSVTGAINKCKSSISDLNNESMKSAFEKANDFVDSYDEKLKQLDMTEKFLDDNDFAGHSKNLTDKNDVLIQANKKLQKDMLNLQSLYKNGKYSIEIYEEEMTKLNNKLQENELSIRENIKAQKDLQRSQEDSYKSIRDKLAEAYRNQHEEEKKAELKANQEKIDALEDQYNGLVDSTGKRTGGILNNLSNEIDKLQNELKSLEDSFTAEDNKDKRSQLENELQAWSRGTDALSKTKVIELQKQLKDLKREEDKLVIQKQIDSKNEEKKNAEESFNNMKDYYQKVADIINDKFDKMLEDKTIYLETDKTLTEGKTAEGQQNIINLITSYVPEYMNAGELLGKSLREALVSEITLALGQVEILINTIASKTSDIEFNVESQGYTSNNRVTSKNHYASYDTGGDTGDWSQGGKLAILHPNEKILNSEQTMLQNKLYELVKNIDISGLLKSVDITRNIFSNIKIPQMYIPNNNTTNSKVEINQDIVVNATTDFDTKNEFDNLNKKIKNSLANVGVVGLR